MSDPVPRTTRPVPRQRPAARTTGRNRRVVQEPKRPRFTLLILAAGVVLLGAAGYLVLMRHVDPDAARAQVQSELAALPLEPGERVERTAPVYVRSPWDYFRSSHGVVAATDRRLLVLTIAPSDRFAGETERAVIERREFPKDTTLRIGSTRTLYGLAPGVRLESRGRRATYAVFDDDRPALRALLANVKQRQDSIHAAAREAERQRQLLAETLRKPIWYRVRPGDAVASIAQRFNTTPERLREINELQNDRIRIGDSLMIKPPAP